MCYFHLLYLFPRRRLFGFQPLEKAAHLCDEFFKPGLLPVKPILHRERDLLGYFPCLFRFPGCRKRDVSDHGRLCLGCLRLFRRYLSLYAGFKCRVFCVAYSLFRGLFLLYLRDRFRRAFRRCLYYFLIGSALSIAHLPSPSIPGTNLRYLTGA
jgi:hypothetical protein